MSTEMTEPLLLIAGHSPCQAGVAAHMARVHFATVTDYDRVPLLSLLTQVAAVIEAYILFLHLSFLLMRIPFLFYLNPLTAPDVKGTLSPAVGTAAGRLDPLLETDETVCVPAAELGGILHFF